MALMNCPECGREISTTAKACVGCGAGVKPPKKKSNGMVWKSLLGAVVTVMILGGIGSTMAEHAEQERIAKLTPAERQAETDKAKADADKAQADEAEFQKKAGRARAAVVTLRASSKNPDSFKVISATAYPDGAACIEYSATNSFNATLRGSAVLTPKDALLVEEHNGNRFVAAWNKLCTRTGTNVLIAVGG